MFNKDCDCKSEFKLELLDNISIATGIMKLICNDIGIPIDWTIVYCNEALAKLEKTSMEELLSHRFFELFPDREKKRLPYYFRAAYAGEDYCIEDIARDKDRYLRIEVYPAGVDGYAFFMITDIADIVSAREQQAIARAEKESKCKDEFFFEMSHRLHTPMNAIIGLSELIKKRADAIGDRLLIDDIERILAEGKLLNDKLSVIMERSSDAEAPSKLFRECEEMSRAECKRVLIVEDNELNAEIAVEILEEYDIEAEVAENGIEGLRMLTAADEDYYSAIIMDINMPYMNGYETTRAIRALDNCRRSNIPIIALSANCLPENKIEAQVAGMNDFLAKPIEIKSLLNALGM